ncbi:BA14K family protein [Hansschlegelia sp.]|uniref:BA14K family protein n=1 Tax=Hansschlegelia sp. TaxID=2041892 RepID=UPI002CF53966|nr:BA14K family protein [Hansschlegelia sp.]HVI27664.1 BA14K family protein [Hansschlegelia sp.]
MKKALTLAFAATFGFASFAEAAPRAPSRDAAPAPSLDQVRADAMARLNAGDIQEVRDRHGHRGGHRGWGGGGHRGWHGGGHRGGHRGHWNRGWNGGTNYGYRRYRGHRYYGGRRYYYGHRYRHRHSGYWGAGIAGLALGAAIASSARPRYRTKSWCASRYRSYNWRTETFIGRGGRLYRCP